MKYTLLFALGLLSTNTFGQSVISSFNAGAVSNDDMGFYRWRDIC